MNAAQKLVLLLVTSLSALAQGRAPQPSPIPVQPPPPIAIAPPPPVANPTPAAPAPKETFVYDQKPLPNQPTLVTGEQAKAVIEKFRTAYPGLGKPRMLIYVNRDLVDEKSGFKLSARNEKTESTSSPTNQSEKISAENRYHNFEKGSPTLSDKQTVRDVERYFGRPLRMAGANLADQQIAVQLLGDHKLAPNSLLGVSDAARKDREALSKVADVVVEVLITSKNVTVPGLSGDQTYAVPEIHANAIRLSDAKILGQAGSSDLTGHDLARVARTFGVRDIAEATALALMEDMVGN